MLASSPASQTVWKCKSAINRLSAARFFLFGSRDIWFVVALPVFLYEVLGWSFTLVGTFMAAWIIGYGMVQASAPKLIKRSHHGQGPSGDTARIAAFVLVLFPGGIALGLQQGWPTDWVLIGGLVLFGMVFAVNSAIHSYLILAYSDHDKVAMNVGFYYMANAGGRLVGILTEALNYVGAEVVVTVLAPAASISSTQRSWRNAASARSSGWSS